MNRESGRPLIFTPGFSPCFMGHLKTKLIDLGAVKDLKDLELFLSKVRKRISERVPEQHAKAIISCLEFNLGIANEDIFYAVIAELREWHYIKEGYRAHIIEKIKDEWIGKNIR